MGIFAPRIIDIWTKDAWSSHLVQPPSLDKQRSGHITSSSVRVLIGSTTPPFTLSIPFACSPFPLPVALWEVSADLSQLSHVCFLYPDTAVWRPSPEVAHTSAVTQFLALGDRDRGWPCGRPFLAMAQHHPSRVICPLPCHPAGAHPTEHFLCALSRA